MTTLYVVLYVHNRFRIQKISFRGNGKRTPSITFNNVYLAKSTFGVYTGRFKHFLSHDFSLWFTVQKKTPDSYRLEFKVKQFSHLGHV